MVQDDRVVVIPIKIGFGLGAIGRCRFRLRNNCGELRASDAGKKALDESAALRKAEMVTSRISEKKLDDKFVTPKIKFKA